VTVVLVHRTMPKLQHVISKHSAAGSFRC